MFQPALLPLRWATRIKHIYGIIPNLLTPIKRKKYSRSSINPLRNLDPDGRQVGVEVEFKKDRAATIEPHRKLTYSLNRESGGLLISPECDSVGTCSEAIIDVLYKAHQDGKDRLRRKSIVDEVWAAYRRSQSTVDNTLGQMVSRKELSKPKPGFYSLSPSTLQRLTSNRDLYSEVSNRERK